MLTDPQLGTVMGMMNDSDKEAYEVAKEWLHNRPDAVQEWVPWTCAASYVLPGFESLRSVAVVVLVETGQHQPPQRGNFFGPAGDRPH